MSDYMKKHITCGSIFIVCLLVSLTIFFAPSFQSQTIQEKTRFSFTLSLTANCYTISPTADEAMRIEMNNCTTLLRPGYPRLPVKTSFYELSEDVVIEQIHILDSKTEWIELSHPVETAQAPFDETTRSVQPSPSTYSYDLFPFDPVKLGFTGSLGSYSYACFRFYPMAYAPHNQSILFYEQLTVQITCTAQSQPEQQGQGHSGIAQRARTLFNKDLSIYDQSVSFPASEREQRYPYVIITTEPLSSSVTFLQNWREITTGAPVTCVTLDWIQTEYDGKDIQEQIRSFLMDTYVDWEIEYVLLVGSTNTIPMRTCYPDKDDHSYQTETPTDFYYADLTGDWDSDQDGYYGERGDDAVDFSAEVFVGRIPFDSPVQVQAYCQKVIQFEQTSEPWKKNALLLGAILNFAGEDGSEVEKTDGATLMEVMKQDVFQPNDFMVTTLYEKEGTQASTYSCTMPLTRNNVQDTYNQGFGIVDWYAHGNPTFAERKIWRDDDGDNIPERFEFTTPLFLSSTDTLSFSNEKPAIVFAASCSNANPDDQLNLGISLVNSGAVGFIGSTTISWGSTGWKAKQDGGIQTINYLFMYYLTQYLQTCGQALYETLFEYRSDYDYWGWKIFQNVYGYVLYGDPYLSLNTDTSFSPPETPESIQGASQGNVAEQLLFSTVARDDDGQEVYYQWDWGDGTISEYRGPFASGERVEVTHSWDSLGEYDVRVKAVDSIGMQSNWSSVHPVTITGPEIQIQQVKGGLFTIKATVENTGSTQATAIPWMIEIEKSEAIVSSTSGTIDLIPTNSHTVISSDVVFGFGPRTVSIFVGDESESVDFFFFGPFLFTV